MKFKADFRRHVVIAAVLIATAMVLAPPASAVPFHVLTEGDPGTSGNVRIRSYSSLSDLISLNQASTSLLGSNLGGTGVSIGGFTYDGNQYHILTEGDPGGSGNVRIRSFNSLSDLLVLNQASTTLLGSNLGGTGVSIGGFTYDGSQYHILTEGDPGGSGNVRIRSFNSLSDLLVLNQASTTLLGSNLGGTGISIGGFTAVPSFVAVPLPATVWIFLTSLGGLGLFDWLRRRRPQTAISRRYHARAVRAARLHRSPRRLR